MQSIGSKCRNCKVEWGKHLSQLAPIKENYEKMIKTTCSWCKEEILKDWSWFQFHGNCCRKCFKIGSNYS